MIMKTVKDMMLVSFTIFSLGIGGVWATQTNKTVTTFTRTMPVESIGMTDFTRAAELSVHAVVHVKTKIPMEQQGNPFGRDPFFEYFFGPEMPIPKQRETPMQEAAGSGVIISTDGYIVTNNHVIDHSSEIEVTLNDKRSFKAKLIGTDPNTDIALLKIDAEKLPTISFGNSDSLKIGEWVLAVGNPFNLTSTVTAGIVSAKARDINIISSNMKIESFIQTDAAVNPGNSGGALVNTRGELVGINTAIASQTGSYAGYAFAVPASIVQKVVADIRQYGVVQRAVLGIEITDINDKLAKEKGLKTLEGAYVNKIGDQSAARKAGLKEGDVIVNVNGVQVRSVSELQEQIGRYSPGDKITIDAIRGEKVVKLDVELKNRQGSTGIVSAQGGIEMLGAKFKALSDKQKDQLQIENGVEVESISKGKFAELGIKPGFIILKINNQSIKSPEDVQRAYDAAINSGAQEKVLFIVGLNPGGKVMYFAVNLAE
jgi:serine protease Do